MTAPIRAALYLRVSTSRQADNDLSIPDQRRQQKGTSHERGPGLEAFGPTFGRGDRVR